MHVDIHAIRRHLQEEMHFRAAFAIRGGAVGVENRVRDGSVFDDATVDKNVLRPASRPGLGQRRDEALNLEPASVASDGEQVGPVARPEEPMRQAEVTRKTAETELRVTLDLDGTGRHDNATGVGFFEASGEVFLGESETFEKVDERAIERELAVSSVSAAEFDTLVAEWRGRGGAR